MRMLGFCNTDPAQTRLPEVTHPQRQLLWSQGVGPPQGGLIHRVRTGHQAARSPGPHCLELRWTPVRRRPYDQRHGQGDLWSKDTAGHKFWVARHGRYAIRIDANRPGVYRWLISLEAARFTRCRPDRDEAAAAVSDALDRLPR